jgi:hypothetical protein
VTTSKASVSAEDNDRIETLIADSAEFFLYAVREHQANRLLGRRFRTDNGKSVDYKGPFYDIFELLSEIGARSDKAQRQKHYYFDSESGLLQKVRYVIERGAVPVTVETVWSEWRKSDNQLYPGTTTRMENGKTIFVFRGTSAVFGAKANDQTFVAIGGR